jgi:two-component system, NarL family, response regulator NreC
VNAGREQPRCAGDARTVASPARRHRVDLTGVPSPESALPANAITIVLADDHAVVRSGLRLVLGSEPDFEVVAEAADVDATLRAVLGYKPSVLVLDLSMPGQRSSLEAIPAVAEASNATRVVVLTMHEDPEFARQALRAGALGYVLKEAADTELVEAVRRAAAGETYLNPRLGAALAASPPTPSGPPDDLTEREVEVLRLIALGHTNAEIADQLCLSVRTVESHRAHIQQKLRRSSRAELVRYALEHGLLDDRAG